MFLKLLKLSFFFILLALQAYAQESSLLSKEVDKSLRLIRNYNFKDAERKIDSLLDLKGISQSQLLYQRLLLQRAYLLLVDHKNAESLSLYLQIAKIAERQKMHAVFCEANIYLSLIHEANNDLKLAYEYLENAQTLSKQHKIEALQSTIWVRMASLHRIFSRSPEEYKEVLTALNLKPSLDSTLTFAKRAIPLAQKYEIPRDLIDSYFLIGACLAYQKKIDESIEYFQKEVPHFKIVKDYDGLFFTYANISNSYLDLKEPLKALAYLDSAFLYYDRVKESGKYSLAINKAELFMQLNKPDSAYKYALFSLNELQKSNDREQQLKIAKLQEEFDAEKREDTISSQRLQILLVSILFIGLVLASFIVFQKNSEINAKNKVIKTQVDQLQKSIEQKEILLSELQHRVKNNLQYVISLLEIQKESVGHSSLEDLIRNNQNRIHSIALLHKKLNVNESVDEVELERYVRELSELVLESYQLQSKGVQLSINCKVHRFSITKAMPIGLIIVELISNSLKHAFTELTDNGKIDISIEHYNSNKFHLNYKDNGPGFDFNAVKTKGLGVEITKGLLDQIGAEFEVKNSNGFELLMTF